MKTIINKLIILFDRSFSKGFWSQLLWLIGIVVILYLVLVGVSLIGGVYSNGADDSQGRWYDVIFILLDPGSSTSAMTTPFTLICALLGLIIFGGMLISVMSNVLERRVESYTNGTLKYNLNNHVIILGFDESVISLIREIYKSHKGYTILMSEKDASSVRELIHASLDSNSEKYIERHLIIMNGIRNADDDLDRLCLRNNVKEIYVLGEEDEVAHDSISMDCVKMIAGKINNEAECCKSAKINCHVKFNSQTIFLILQSVDIEKEIKDNINFLPYNFNDIWAQKALATLPEENLVINGAVQDWTFDPLDGHGITADSKKHVHLVIFGMNEMGVSLALNAAHVLHFPNFVEGDFSTCSHITFIDSEASMRGKGFRRRYHTLFDLSRWRECVGNEGIYDECRWHDPMVDKDSSSPYKGFLGNVNFMDIQWEFIEAGEYDECVGSYLSSHAANGNEILSIAMCFDNSDRNISAVLAFGEEIVSGAHQIIVRQPESPVSVNILRKRPGYGKVKPFGIMSECYFGDMNHEKYGKLVNACYDGIDLNNTKLVAEAWDGKTVAIKWSNIYCANMLYSKLRMLGFDTNQKLDKSDIDVVVKSNEVIIQRTEHNRWNTEKILLGFRPLVNEEEREEWKTDKESKKRLKESLCHLDILSNEDLKRIDPGAVDYDITVNEKISDLYYIANQ